MKKHRQRCILICRNKGTFGFKTIDMGNSPLHDATYRGDQNAVTLLISLGANVEARNTEKMTPLHLVRDSHIAKILIENGADVNSRESNNMTPLHLVRDSNIAKILIENGADVNNRDSNKRTPLMPIEHNYKKQWLMDDTKGNSPLHDATNRGDQNAVTFLISLGANVEARNTEGNSPFDYAANRGDQDVVTLLISLGANVEARNTDVSRS
ncbi:unnamed protein product [Mytilus edulis]|uniref:Ankyrin repeat protein n=1 Tax=Mytilus edulis TaxID=6550 RepID=A0A8S3SP69_MYTED|nr:unnamed protein product [Mytilus edulis]